MVVPYAPDARNVSADDLSAITPDLAPKRICSVRASSHKVKRRTRRPQQPSPLRTLIPLVATDTYRSFAVLVTGDSRGIPQH